MKFHQTATPRLLSFNRPLRLAPIFCLLTIIATPLRAQDTMEQPAQSVLTRPLHYLAADSASAASVLAPPPLPDSAEQAADLNEVRAVYHAATPQDKAVAAGWKKFDAYTFTPAIGAFFVSSNLPMTTAFFDRVQKDAETVTDQGKDCFKRPRPYRVDPSLANGKLEKSFSYPSGHSTESMVLALVLADLFPAHRDAIVAEARSIGWHRVMIARHYPTDIYAGRVLAKAIVRQMKASPDFQKDFAAARVEIRAAEAAAKN
jgi:acid phosphatase (class A)